MVASCYLVKTRPDNPRPANLLAGALDVEQKYADEITLLRYVVATSPGKALALMNLATAYLNAGLDENAKAVLDQVVALDPGNKDAHRALGGYWFNRGNLPKAREGMFKAATFMGVVQSMTEPKNEEIRQEKLDPSDSTEQLKEKLDKLKEIKPTLTSDITQESCPDVARQIRDKYGKLSAMPKCSCPIFPWSTWRHPKSFARTLPS